MPIGLADAKTTQEERDQDPGRIADLQVEREPGGRVNDEQGRTPPMPTMYHARRRGSTAAGR